MKKTILLLVAIALTSAKMMAEGLTATLQQGETMTAFYGVNAFVDAYNAAEDGAVITLSEGKFNDVSSIEKSITVIGNMAFIVEGYERTYLSNANIKADNITIEGIQFENLYLGNINNCHIKKCNISNNLSYINNTTHNKTCIDQCFVNCDYAIKTSVNYCINNSIILYFQELNSASNIAYITNCYIVQFYNFRYKHYQPYAIYKNCVLYLDIDNYDYKSDLHFSSPSEFRNNYFLRICDNKRGSSSYVRVYFDEGCLNIGNTYSDNSSKYIRHYYINEQNCLLISSHNQIGDDGTPVGITGGSGFSPYPSVPRIISKSIASKTDSEGKLNVNISVSTEETLVKDEDNFFF